MIKKRSILLLSVTFVMVVFVFSKTTAAEMGTALAYQGFSVDDDAVDTGITDHGAGLYDPRILAHAEKATEDETCSSPTDSDDPHVEHYCAKSGNNLEVTVVFEPIAYFSANEFFYTYSFSDGNSYELLHNEYYVQHTYTNLDYPLDVQTLVYLPDYPTPWFSHLEQITCSYTCGDDLCLNGELEGKCCDEYCCTDQAHCKACPSGAHICCASFMDECQEVAGETFCCPSGKIGCWRAGFGIYCCDPGREIDVQGNGISILNNDNLPRTADHTDFGSVAVADSPVTHTFTIVNSGAEDLNLTDSPQRVTVIGVNFSLHTDAATPIASVMGETTFVVEFSPGAIGTFTGTVSIANDDSNESPYTFEIQGTGEEPTAVGLESITAQPAPFQMSETVKIFGGMIVLLALTRFGWPKFMRRK